jgi:hypothetical protein
MSKRQAIKNLSGDAIDMVPVDFDWTAHERGEDSGQWDCFEATRCEKCGIAIVNSSGDDHNAIDCDSDCTGHVPCAEGPMMSYFYPCDIRDAEEAARLLVDTCVCVVNVDGKTGLALTGGGMDLSWEICEAFMVLGHLPPLHFADLPGMAGRGTDKRDRWIVAGCVASARLAVQRAKRIEQRIRETMKRERERQELKEANARISAVMG